MLKRSLTSKVHRRELAQSTLEMLQQPTLAPRSVLETTQVIWQRVLQIPNLDPDDHFLDLGGTSLQAARIEMLM